MIYQFCFPPHTPAVTPYSMLHAVMNVREVTRPDAMPGIGNEYCGIAELWLRPRDQDAWIGFTSCNQRRKKVNLILKNRDQIEGWLRQYDLITWCWYKFSIPLCLQAEVLHPGITVVMRRLYAAFGGEMPADWFTLKCGVMRNYWIMRKDTFDVFMQWSYPRVQWLVARKYGGSHKGLAGYVAERLLILWYMEFKRTVLVPRRGEMHHDSWYDEPGGIDVRGPVPAVGRLPAVDAQPG